MNVGEGAGLSGMKLGRPPLGDWLEVAPVSGPEGDEVAGEQADRQRARPSQGSATRRRTRFVIGRLGRVDRVVGDEAERRSSGEGNARRIDGRGLLERQLRGECEAFGGRRDAIPPRPLCDETGAVGGQQHLRRALAVGWAGCQPE